MRGKYGAIFRLAFKTLRRVGASIMGAIVAHEKCAVNGIVHASIQSIIILSLARHHGTEFVRRVPRNPVSANSAFRRMQNAGIDNLGDDALAAPLEIEN